MGQPSCWGVYEYLRLLSVALLKGFGLIIAFGGFSVVGSTGFFAILVFLDVLATLIPAEESVEEALQLWKTFTSFDLISNALIIYNW